MADKVRTWLYLEYLFRVAECEKKFHSMGRQPTTVRDEKMSGTAHTGLMRPSEIHGREWAGVGYSKYLTMYLHSDYLIG
jgi:hypothetical protein